jgi:hypothetical protein
MSGRRQSKGVAFAQPRFALFLRRENPLDGVFASKKHLAREARCIIRVAVIFSPLDRRSVAGFDNVRTEISPRRFPHGQKILCYYAALSSLKFSFNNGNRAGQNRRIPQYTMSSTDEAVKQHF